MQAEENAADLTKETDIFLERIMENILRSVQAAYHGPDSHDSHRQRRLTQA